MFTQELFGTFSVDVGGDFHCGPDHTSPKVFNYEAELHYPRDGSLDEHGFLVDNQSADQYFSNLGYTEDSCELLVRRAACVFWNSTDGRCHLVKVAIWGISQKAKVKFELNCTPADAGLEHLVSKASTGGAS